MHIKCYNLRTEHILRKPLACNKDQIS